VLVLVPKRLRDNWTLYKANDRRNFLAPDRFNYDVLNHTDLSRDGGLSGDIDLAHVNWGNYDLVVIDESHNFRNKKTPRVGSETRYDRLMRKIIREGVKTRVLMLSATPVNNRLADLRNQIAFVTEGDDTALLDHGISSVDSTTRLAQKQFNRWLDLEDADRTPPTPFVWTASVKTILANVKKANATLASLHWKPVQPPRSRRAPRPQHMCNALCLTTVFLACAGLL
jgi:SNF2 family DNA or RNA helicase